MQGLHMKYRELTEQQYEERLRLVIVGAEGLHPRAEDVGDGKATIGWGYTFNRSNNVRIWSDAGIELDERQWDRLRAIDAAPSAQRTRLGLAFDRELSTAEADSLLRASMKEYERPADRLGMPLSDERVALTSIAYNRGPAMLLGSSSRPEHPVMDAIREGDRAEAWYQLRYNCWGSDPNFEGGLRKRRFAEAHVFGLYDDPDNVPPAEARNVMGMHDRHRTEIDRVEDRFGDSLDAAPANPNRIAQSNRDYPALVRLYGPVPTLEDALAPAQRVADQSSLGTNGERLRIRGDADGDGPTVPSRAVPVPTTSGEGPERSGTPLLRQSQDAVRRLDDSLGRTYDDASDRMAASLAHLAGANGFTRIDHVVLNNATTSLQKGENVFVVQGGLTDVTNRVAHMKTREAIATPVEQSLDRLARVPVEQALQRDMSAPEAHVRYAAQRMAV